MDKYSSRAVNGLIPFQDVLLKALPASNFSLTLVVTQHIRTLPYNQLTGGDDLLVPIEFRINVTSLPCEVGFIKTLDLSCLPCPPGTYSISDPMDMELILF